MDNKNVYIVVYRKDGILTRNIRAESFNKCFELKKDAELYVMGLNDGSNNDSYLFMTISEYMAYVVGREGLKNLEVVRCEREKENDEKVC